MRAPLAVAALLATLAGPASADTPYCVDPDPPAGHVCQIIQAYDHDEPRRWPDHFGSYDLAQWFADCRNPFDDVPQPLANDSTIVAGIVGNARARCRHTMAAVLETNELFGRLAGLRLFCPPVGSTWGYATTNALTWIEASNRQAKSESPAIPAIVRALQEQYPCGEPH